MLTLKQALAQLPDGADEIAAYLIEQDCRGARKDSCRCPIANYLIGQGFEGFEVTEVEITDDGLTSDGADVVRMAVNGTAIADFVLRFDRKVLDA